LTKLRVRLEPGLIRAMFGVQTALARFPTHAYKHGGPSKGPDIPITYNLALTVGWVNRVTREKKKCDVALWRKSIRGLSGTFLLE
jgi:hypothetical protein